MPIPPTTALPRINQPNTRLSQGIPPQKGHATFYNGQDQLNLSFKGKNEESAPKKPIWMRPITWICTAIAVIGIAAWWKTSGVNPPIPTIHEEPLLSLKDAFSRFATNLSSSKTLVEHEVNAVLNAAGNNPETLSEHIAQMAHAIQTTPEINASAMDAFAGIITDHATCQSTFGFPNAKLIDLTTIIENLKQTPETIKQWLTGLATKS